MHILIFSPVQIIMGHPLHLLTASGLDFDRLDGPDCMYVFVMYHKTFPNEFPTIWQYGLWSFQMGVQN